MHRPDSRTASLHDARRLHHPRDRPPGVDGRAQPEPGRGDGARRRRDDAHLRRASEELYFFTAGRGRVRLGDDELDVAAGDCVVIPPGIPHKLWNAGDDPLVSSAAARPPKPRGHRRHRRPGAQGPGRRRHRDVMRRLARRSRPRPPRGWPCSASPPPPPRAVRPRRARRALGGHQRAERHRLPRPDLRRLGPPYARLVVPGTSRWSRPPAHRGPRWVDELAYQRRPSRMRVGGRRPARGTRDRVPSLSRYRIAVGAPRPGGPRRPCLHPWNKANHCSASDGRAAGAGRRYDAVLKSVCVSVPRPRASPDQRGLEPSMAGSAAACAAARRACRGCTTTRMGYPHVRGRASWTLASRAVAARSGPRRPAASCGS